jgi:zinicin-like metallopeptidase
VVDVEPGRFEEMIMTALDGLPEDLGQMMRNVAVTVEQGAGPPGLLGLYEGIPLTSRTSDYAGVLPDLCRSITRLGVSPALFIGMTGAVLVGLPGAAQDHLSADVPGARVGRPGVP